MSLITWSPHPDDFEELMRLIRRDQSIKYVSWSLEGVRLTRKIAGRRVITEIKNEKRPDMTLEHVAKDIARHVS